MSESGTELRENNDKIVQLMSLLKQQRDEMNYLIQKQQEEKSKIQNEIERLSFKLSLLTKSLNQRVQAKANYDRTIQEIEENYTNLVEESGKLLFTLNKEVHLLEEIMDKKIGTYSTTTTTNTKEKEKEQPQLPAAVPPPNETTDETSSFPSSPPPEQMQEAMQALTDGQSRSDPPSDMGITESAIGSAIDSLSQHDEESGGRSSKLSEDSEKVESPKKLSIVSDIVENLNKGGGGNRRRSSAAQSEIDQISLMDDRKEKKPDEKPYNLDYNNPPPIKDSLNPFNRRHNSDDVELQSYREAYGRQHNAPSPPMSIAGAAHSPPRRLSNPGNVRRTSRRKSDL